MRKAAVLGLAVMSIFNQTACADVEAQGICDSSYPNNCIFPAPPDLDCSDIPHRSFRVQGTDSHQFDQDGDGLGCRKNDIRLERRERSAGTPWTNAAARTTSP
jgi:hypothetical protein